jgi:hypothetical protein
MSNRLRVLAAFVAVFAISVPSKANAEEHKTLYRAHYELEEAKSDLKTASHDFGGHRVKALEAVDAAISQIDVCLKAVGDKVGAYKPEMTIYKGYKNCPHIRHAIVELRASRTEMKEAKHDFGGHREKAIKDIDYAIEQLEKAIEFAK